MRKLITLLAKCLWVLTVGVLSSQGHGPVVALGWFMTFWLFFDLLLFCFGWGVVALNPTQNQEYQKLKKRS